MARKDDDRLQLRLANKLSNIGIRSPCRVNVETHNGSVTLQGMVQYDYQKRAAIQAARSMDGVQSVTDRVKVEAPVRGWEEEAQKPHEGVTD